MDSKHKRLLKSTPDVKKDIANSTKIVSVKEVNPSPNPNHNYFSVLADY
jgi:hypothetical protein